jgi:hypothetical protein
MAAPTGIYTGLTPAELATLRAEILASMKKIRDAHQSYSRPGFSFNRVAYDSLRQDLAEVEFAIATQGGGIMTRTYADLSA